MQFNKQRIEHFIHALSELQNKKYQALLDDKDSRMLCLENTFQHIRLKTTNTAFNSFEKLKSKDPLNPIFVCGDLGAGNPLRKELVHTKTLAFLLDNTKKHGFGDALIRALILNFDTNLISNNNEFIVERVLSEKTTLMGDRIDIWVTGNFHYKSDKMTPWLLAIEAKVDSDEGKDQLSRYNNEINTWISMKYQERGFQPIVWKVFLTPKKVAPSCYSWIPMSFGELTIILWNAIRNYLKNVESHPPGLPIARCYLACVLNDIIGIPVPIKISNGNPYSFLKYFDGSDFYG